MKAPVALLILLVTAPAAVAGSFTPPAGCEVFMTVQSKACRVSLEWLGTGRGAWPLRLGPKPP